jgi:carbamoyl-phosphate synthase small subunit
MKSEAILALEDGRIFRGRAWGATGQRTGEIVFNTALTGYQEILTDPSYAGQIVTMTYPLIGNYGVNAEDVESRRPFAQGMVVREYSEIVSNWRAGLSLDEYLKRHGIVALSEIDTRALVRHVREKGAMRACLSSIELDPERLIETARNAPEMLGRNLVDEVTCGDRYEWSSEIEQQATRDLRHLKSGESASLDAVSAVRHLKAVDANTFHVVAYDFGIKYYILRYLSTLGCRVTVVPARTSADDVLALAPDGIFLSNGPGDPAALSGIVSEVKRLVGAAPIFGICLGHQLLGLAFGGRSYKLKFGHRGGNQPVKNMRTGRVEITSHNHGFAIDPESLASSEIDLTHFNLNDGTLEGLRHRSLPVFSVQYHPEAGPGPHDAAYLFEEFLARMQDHREELRRVVQA